MSSKTIVITLAISLASSMLVGCASDDSATTYSQGQMRQMQTVQLGTVISVQQVKTKGEDNGLLTLGGAALGGIAGSTMGGGNRGSAHKRRKPNYPPRPRSKSRCNWMAAAA